MNTWRDVAYDIQTDLKQLGDDKDISIPHIIYWMQIVANRLRALHIQKRTSGAYLSTFDLWPVQLVNTGQNPDLHKKRKFIELPPQGIYDFDNNGGVAYISYADIDGQCSPPFIVIKFSRTTAENAEILYYNEYEKPKPDNPAFYRVGNYIYFLGIENVPVATIEMGLYCTVDPRQELNIDAELDFPAETLKQLKIEVLELGRFMLMIPKERINNGDDDLGNSAVPKKGVKGPEQQQYEAQAAARYQQQANQQE